MMIDAHRPHSEPYIVIDTARFLAEHPDNAGVSDAIRLARAYVGLYEQLEAANERLAWAARLLRYPDGGDQFSIDCRNWLSDYYAASNPAREHQ